MARRRRDRLDARRRPGPHEQHPARRVVDHEPPVPAEARRPELALAVARHDEQAGALALGDDLALDASAPHDGPRVAAEPLARVFEQRLRGLVGDLPQLRPRLRRRAAAEQPGTPAGGDLLGIARRRDEQRHLGVVGHEGGRLVDARLPAPLGDPDDRSHHTTRKANHRASVQAASAGGTVSAPSLRNSPRSVDSSWAWRTRRHSSVASEPTYVRFGPTLTPISIASTGAGPDAAATGRTISVAGRLLTRFATTAASAATASRAGSPSPCGTSASTVDCSPWSPAARTTIARPRTKTRNGGSAARTSASGPRRSRTASASAPAAATHTGASPTSELSAKPASVATTTPSAKRGTGTAAARTARFDAGASRSDPNARASTIHSTASAVSHGSAMSAAKRVNDRPLRSNASRLVRFDTGRSSDALLARWGQAYTCGRALILSRAAVANTTGVSRRTVASRLSTAVVPAAAANTIASSRRGRPRAPVAIAAPSASNSPAARQPSASSSSAARNASVGARSPAAERASSTLSTPKTTSRTAHAAATAQSGARRGRATAAASVATSARSAAASLIARRPAGRAPRHHDQRSGGASAARRDSGRPADSAGPRLPIPRAGPPPPPPPPAPPP